MIDPLWIVTAVFGWVGLGAFGLAVFWKSWTDLNQYFELMYAGYAVELREFGFPPENPMPVTMGVSKSHARARIFLRLLIWGAPRIPEAPAEAEQSIKSYRIWSVLGLMPFALVFGAMSFLAVEFLFLPIAGCILYLAILKPAPWR